LLTADRLARAVVEVVLSDRWREAVTRSEEGGNGAMTVAARDWGVLQRAIDGRVVLPGAFDYGSAAKPEMVRFQGVRPEAVVLCESPADVSATIAHARRHGLHVAIRSGGHSVAGRSSTEGVVLDVAPMDGVSVDQGVTTVGAGVRLGALYDALQPHGLTIPAGSSHSVGIAGLTLGGGLGVLGRKHGLACDHLLGAQVVLADGQIVECNERENHGLFWGLRGAGSGNFGVVTSFDFSTVAAPPTTVFHLVWPLVHANDLIEVWQEWAPTGPDGLDATLRLSATASGERPPLVDLFGAVAGSDADAGRLLDDLVARVGAEPASASLRHMSYRDAKRYLDGLGPADEWHDEPPPPPPSAAGLLFTKSEFFKRSLPREAIAALVDNLPRALETGQSREVTFTPWGGAYNRVRADATAFVHRDELFIVQHLLTLDPSAATSGRGPAQDWMARSWSLVHPWGSGRVYPNFPDPDLEDWAHAYYGNNYDRLLRIKATYDPDGVFRFDQSLPPTPGPEASRKRWSPRRGDRRRHGSLRRGGPGARGS
jgi:FAD/FMN-containing dehydrogenase